MNSQWFISLNLWLFLSAVTIAQNPSVFLSKIRGSLKSKQVSDDEYFRIYNLTLENALTPKNMTDEMKMMMDLGRGHIKKMLKKAAFEIASYYLPFQYENGTGCREAIDDLYRKDNFLFALKMVDSWGKIPDGVFFGNFNPTGMFDECLQIESRNKLSKGQYCYIKVLKVAPKQSFADEIANKSEEPQDFLTIGDRNVSQSYGTCIPSACTVGELKSSLTNVYEPKGHQLKDVFCYRADDETEFTAGDISFLVTFSLIGCLMFAGSIIDLLKEEKTEHTGLNRFLSAFSAHSNFKKVFTLNPNPCKDSISCLHGIKALSIIWVLFNHQNLVTLIETVNLAEIPRYSNVIWFQVVVNGTFVVDSFLFVGGLLVTYVTLPILERNDGKLNLFAYYIHRYVRLTPPIAATVWFQATVARFFVSGPFASWMEPTTKNCQNMWWTHLLYINNFYVDIAEVGSQECIGQGWYTAVDMQLYVLTPLIILPLYHHKCAGKIWLAFLTLASALIPGFITLIFDFAPFNKLNYEFGKGSTNWYYFYAAPFCRAGSYLIGMCTGFILYKIKDFEIDIKYWQQIAGWITSVFTSSALLFGVYRYNRLANDAPTDWTTIEQFFYGGFSRLLWAVPLAWTVIMCHKGYGGPVNWFLSHPGFQPISKISYGMYLSSVGVQFIVVLNSRIPFYLDHLTKMTETVGSLFWTIMLATVLTLTVEAPVINLEKELFRRKDSEDKHSASRYGLSDAENKMKNCSTIFSNSNIDIRETPGNIAMHERSLNDSKKLTAPTSYYSEVVTRFD